MRSVLSLSLMLLAGYLVIAAALYLLQDHLIFHPRPPGPEAPPDARPIYIERDHGVTLRGWIVGPEQGPLLVYFGGNAEELSRVLGTFARLPATSVLVNYRGYGSSGGEPGAAALLDDALAVVAAARERLGAARPLVLFGRSLGSGIAAHTAAETGADGLILMSPYRSLAHLARRFAPLLPVDVLLRHRIDTTAVLDELPDRVLVLLSELDRIIPAEESRALLSRMPQQPRLVTFEGGHNVPLEQPELREAIVEFLREFPRNPPQP